MNTTGMRRWTALAAIILGVLAVGLDLTVLSVALPTLARALNASESQLQWFQSGYALVLAAGMLPAGLLGDRYGRKAVMIGSLVLFAVGSLGCAYAPSAEAFIAARLVLGVAGAGLIVMALSVLTVLFDERERPRAVGIWAAANFLSMPIGPILGGWLLTHYWWGIVFVLNVPVAVVGMLAVAAFVPESRASERPGIDGLGVALSSGGLVAVTYGLIQAGENAWTDPSGVTPMLAGLGILVGFVAWERHVSARPGGQPLVDLALFRSPAFAWGVVLAATALVAMIGVLFTMPQYFQAIMGTDAEGSGIRLLPIIAGLMVGAIPADMVAARIGPRVSCALGFAILAVGLGLGATMQAGTGDGFIAAWTAITGVGAGLALATAASGALVELPSDRAGVGAALMQATQKLGAPFGSAILGSVLNATYQHRLPLADLPAAAADAVEKSVFAGVAVAHQAASPALLEGVRAAFVAGSDDALRVSAGIAVAGVLVGLAFMPGRKVVAGKSVRRVPAVGRMEG